MLKKHTCEGEEVSPELHIRGIPEGTRSFALILDDPDAPSGIFTHWVVWNIPIVEEIKSGNLPDGSVQGLNSNGNRAYAGPCPPKGTHSYIFTLYALDTVFDHLDPANSDRHSLLDMMTGHIITTAELVGLYCKKAQ